MKKERHKKLMSIIGSNPFIKDDELAGMLKVSVATIRTDRRELGINEYRERVQKMAKNAAGKNPAEIVDMELFHDGVSIVETKDVATYDLKPEMSAPEVGMDLVEAIKSDKYDVIIINFANPDMVGHTGVIPAAIKAVEKVDELVGKAVDAVKDVDGVLFICADHGNAEKMIDYETGAPHTAHTTNPVPFILVNYDENYTLREGGRLCDIAPTLIEIMGLEKPVEMTGESLLVKKN